MVLFHNVCDLAGGKKRSYYHDDIWNIKYLPKFKWTNLTEKLGMYASVAYVCTSISVLVGRPCRGLHGELWVMGRK